MTLRFAVTCYQNEYLSLTGDEVHAIVTVTCEPSGRGSSSDRAAGAEVIMVDVSGSMEGAKLAEARAATAAAIRCISDGVHFGVIAGNERAVQVFPTAGLIPANVSTRQQAIRAVGGLHAQGGTAIGEWISMAARLQAPAHGVRHGILLTDGRDEHETPEALDAALGAARESFQCDCRGVGTDWNVPELRKVADALTGSVDIVADPTMLANDFASLMKAAMRRSVADVRLRVLVSRGSELLFVTQVAPELLDLAGSRVPGDHVTPEFSTGAWGAECRDYHLAIRVPPGHVGDEMLVARVSVVADGEDVATVAVRTIRTDDPELGTRVHEAVAHFMDQETLAKAVQEGLEARRSGDINTATTKLGIAVRLADESGHPETAMLLERVVDVEERSTGRVQVKSRVDRVDEMTLETRSTRTVRAFR